MNNILIDILIRLDIQVEFNSSFINVLFRERQYLFLQNCDIDNNIERLRSRLHESSNHYNKTGEALISLIEAEYRKYKIEKILDI